MDRISELPEPIRHHILSFVPFEQVIQTTFLSKTWKQTWHSYPFLDFGGSIVGGIFRFRNHGILNLVEQALRNRYEEMISIERFTIAICLLDNHNYMSKLDRCVYYLTECNVKELKLLFEEIGNTDSEFKGSKKEGMYPLPEMVLRTKSIQLLELRGCKLPESIVNTTEISLSCLRNLSLINVYIDDRLLKNLFVGCPMIELLVMKRCHEFKSLDLSNNTGKKLNTLVLEENLELKSVEIKEACNLEYLQIREPQISNMLELMVFKKLKEIKLYKFWISNSNLRRVTNGLPLLEKLHIVHCELEFINISSASLKELHIAEGLGLVKIKIKTPNLDNFAYHGDLVPFTSTSKPLRLLKTVLHLLRLHPYISRRWYIRFIKFLINFRHSQVLRLSCTYEGVLREMRQARQVIPPPLLGVKHLKYETYEQQTKIGDYLDDMIWVSPHTHDISINMRGFMGENIIISFSFSDKKKKVIYEREDNDEIPHCCKSVPVLCWKHCINQVHVEITETQKEKGNKKSSYFFQGDEILETINGRFQGFLEDKLNPSRRLA